MAGHTYTATRVVDSTTFVALHGTEQQTQGIRVESNPMRPKQAHLRDNHVGLGKDCTAPAAGICETHPNHLDDVTVALWGPGGTLKKHEVRLRSVENIFKAHWKQVSGEPGLHFEFDPHQPSAPSQTDHHFVLPTEQALLVMAGAHDKPGLFCDLLFHREVGDDMVMEACKRLHGGAFISPACVSDVVHTAARQAMHAQNPDGQDDGASTYRAHRVVAAYLVGELRNTTPCAQEASAVFGAIMRAVQQPVDDANTATDDFNRAAYSGIIIGIVFAGVMRFFDDEVTRGKPDQARLETALEILSFALGCIPLVERNFDIIGQLATPVVQRVIRTKDCSEFTIRLRVKIEKAALRAGNGFNAIEFNLQMARTMRDCGFTH